MLMCRLGQVNTFGSHSCLKGDILAFAAMCLVDYNTRNFLFLLFIYFFLEWTACQLAHFTVVSQEHLNGHAVANRLLLW